MRGAIGVCGAFLLACVAGAWALADPAQAQPADAQPAEETPTEGAPDAPADPETLIIDPTHPLLAAFGEAIEDEHRRSLPEGAETRWEPMVGVWDFVSLLYVTERHAVESITGTMTIEPVIGGRALRLEMRGGLRVTSTDLDYAGDGLITYDADKGEYVLVWRDVLAARLVTAYGSLRDDGQRLEFFADLPHGTLRMEYLFEDGRLTQARSAIRPQGLAEFRRLAQTSFTTPIPERRYGRFLATLEGRGEGPLQGPDLITYSRHLAHLRELANSGRASFAATLGDPRRQTIVLHADTPEEARALLDGDPAVDSGFFAVRIDRADLIYEVP